jgi:hypothetical protein
MTELPRQTYSVLAEDGSEVHVWLAGFAPREVGLFIALPAGSLMVEGSGISAKLSPNAAADLADKLTTLAAR